VRAARMGGSVSQSVSKKLGFFCERCQLSVAENMLEMRTEVSIRVLADDVEAEAGQGVSGR